MYKYSAFISYRHVSRDKDCAEWLLNELESYKVPKPLLRAGYPARLGKVFRDKDELPSSGSLNNQIEDALRASRFLIVLCSPSTPDSRWVSREIEIFKELGRTDKIIPVLLESEPSESYPAVLQTIRLINFNEALESPPQIDWEPIGADFRLLNEGHKKEIKRTEFLRIVASILSCSYDDLKQREQERLRVQRRKKITMGALAVALVGVFSILLYSSHLRTENEKLATVEAERAKVASRLKELEDRSMILASIAKREKNPTTSALIALDAWNYSDPIPEKQFENYVQLPIELRNEALKVDWLGPGHSPPDHSLAAAVVRAKLSNPRETFYRHYQQDDFIIGYSSDFSKIATGYKTGIYYIEDLVSGKLLLSGQIKGSIDNIAIKNKVAHIVSDGNYHAIEIGSGKLIYDISFEQESLITSVFSPDIDYVALAFKSGELKLIDFTTSKLEHIAKYRLIPEITWPGSLLLIADGNSHLAYDVKKKVFPKRFDMGGDIDELIARKNGANEGLGFRVDKKTLKTIESKNGRKQSIEIENLKSYKGDGIYIDFDTERLYANTSKKKIVIYSLATGEKLDTELRCNSESLSAILLFDDNKKIAAGTEDGSLCVWSTQGFELLVEDSISNNSIGGLTYDTSHKQLFMALRSGEIIGWNVERNKDRKILPFCEEEEALQLFFDPSGNYLFARAGEMGLCRWDLKDNFKMTHMPSFTMFNPFPPFVYKGKDMVLTDRMGNIIIGSLPELDNSKILSIENEVFMTAGLFDTGKYVLGHAASGNVYIWNTTDFDKPVKLKKRITSAVTVFPTSNISRFIPVADADGNAFIFDATDGRLITSIKSQIRIGLVESNDQTAKVIFVREDRKMFYLDYSKLKDLHGEDIQLNKLKTYLEYQDIFIYIPFTRSGSIYLTESSGRLPVYTLNSPLQKKSMSGGAYLRTLPNQGLLAGIASSLKGEHEIIIDNVPELIARINSPQFLEELDEAKKLTYNDVLIWSEFWRSESHSWLFKHATMQIDRCLTSNQRLRYNLSKDPPCWCADKPYPTQGQWTESLGYNPFTEERSDGSRCSI